MVNNRGILRIIEASIAVLVILTVILTFSLVKRAQNERDLSVLTGPLLEEVAKDNVLRAEIISDNSPDNRNSNISVTNFLSSRINDPSLCYRTRVCDVNDLCSLETYPKDITGNIYASSRIISSTLSSSKSKKVSIFMWENTGKGCD